jgi:glycosyltransferase involved in cell wall biosynthesis
MPDPKGAFLTSISVVIPTKDRLPYLRSAIDAFLAHGEVAEVIVVVDGCTDDTLTYVTQLAAENTRVRYIDNGRNRGLPYSRNAGVELAQYEYVFTGEDDLEISDSFFETLLEHMSRSGADIISARNIFRLETETADEALRRMSRVAGDAVNRRTIAVNTGIIADDDRQQLLLPAPMLCKREVFSKIQFDERYEVNFWREETDFQLTAYEHGFNLVYCPHTASFNFEIVNDRGGAHSAVGLKRVIWMIRNNWRLVKKHRDLIGTEFQIGNIYVYIFKFAVRRLCFEFAKPALVRPAAAILRQLTRTRVRSAPLA